MATKTKPKRAIGIIRVSHVGDREGDSFVSPEAQRERIEHACERDDSLELIDILPEPNVSGGAPLEKRPGLRRAIERIEDGEAKVLIVAFFDRLVRSLQVQAEVVERVERAKGQVLALDTGRVTNGSAGQWLSATMLGAVAEYQRGSSGERARDGQVSAVERGVWMSRYVPPGCVVDDDGKLRAVPKEIKHVEKAFRMRRDDATIATILNYLRRHGFPKISYNAVVRMLGNRAYVGEVRFGSLVNPKAHPPIIDPDLFDRAQRSKPSKGRKANSDRLLARQRVLYCAGCGRAMSVSSGSKGRKAFYRCSSHVGDECPHPVTIAADMIETFVSDAVRTKLSDARGRASAETEERHAEAAAQEAQTKLDATLHAFNEAGVATEPAAIERLAKLREERDRTRDYAHELRGTGSIVTINADADWDRLSLDGRRALIRSIVERVTVAPGKGLDRVSLKLRGE